MGASDSSLTWRVLLGTGASLPASIADASSPNLRCQVLHEGDPNVVSSDSVAVEVLVPGSSPTFWDWAAPACDPERLTMALTVVHSGGLPENVTSVAALPASDLGQFSTLNAILDLYGQPHLLMQSKRDELDCIRRGASVEFFDVPASNLLEAVDGLQALMPSLERSAPIGVIGTVRFNDAQHFSVCDTVGEMLEPLMDLHDSEVHMDICYVWRDGLQTGVSLLMIGSRTQGV